MSHHSNPLLGSIDLGVALGATEVSVYFARDAERLDFVENQGDWSAYAQAQVMAALDSFAAVADLTFSLTDSPEGATFRLAKSAAETGSLGFMNGPDPAYGDTQGIAWFNTHFHWGDARSGMLDPGSYTYTIFLHEFGHGLGLAHPHDTGGGSSVMPDIGVGHGLDQGLYTVMSYNDGWPDHPDGSPESRAWGWNLGPSALDIAVLQAKYGANAQTAAGATRYRLPEADGAGTGYGAIWDAGGRDTILHKGDAGAVIDLRAATLRAEPGGGGWASHVEGVHGGFTIAHGVVIENATGGQGDDRLSGNAADNRLTGRGGDDRMLGRDGQDALSGGRGDDRLSGGAGRDVLSGGGGADVLRGGGGADSLAGGGGNDLLIGGGGADVFVFVAGDGMDRIRGFQAGRDTLRLDRDLWQADATVDLSVAQVLDSFARQAGNRVVLEFDGGEMLILSGVADPSDLAQDVVLV